MRMKNNPTNITSEGASKKLVPEFRFPEFVNDDEWISTSLGNKCIYVSSGKNKEKKEKGEFPVYGSTGVIGYSGSFVYDFPAILVARVGANAGQINKVTGKYDVTDNTIIIQLNDDCNLDYVYYFLASRNINIFVFGSGQPLITSSLLKKLILSLPSLSEQKRIAQCLSSLDELIAATKEKVVLLKEHKRGLIQKLFPAKGKTLPELRFPEFMNEGEWEEVYLGDVFTERVESNCTYLPLLSLGQDGVYPQSESSKRDISNKDKSKYKRICPNDIGYNTMRMWQGRSALSQIEGIVSPAYTIITPKKGMDPLFLSILLKLPYVIRDFHSHSQGLVNDTLNCKFNDFAKVKAKIPSLIEQQKIASILSSLADEIEQYSEIVKALEIHKKGMMQKLFPQ